MDYMDEARKEADINLVSNEGGPFGAVIVKDGRIVGRGHNRVLAKNDPTCHAEMEAIRDACRQLKTYDLSGCELYTSCYPCPMCMSAAIWANIKIIRYGNTAEDAAKVGFRDDMIYDFIRGNCENSKVVELEQISRDSTIETFHKFARKNDKTIY
ncbi:MAG: nucleoside deaminase [Anaerovibrio sp.]|uniref:nucleoside deaminase n=1 Tax=Anaerovibrio sp. TaxID=1872532 RepID=UPI0025D77F88|nr:nucleoside deaminase [Anaerovibrio sp.]MCR5176471.1 nucleoside deaminase [Anaerovibrio sp.]